MREGLALVEQYPDDVLGVNYEKLCQNPVQELKKITAFTELSDSDQTFLDYGQQILKLVPRKPEFELHPAIAEPFKRTLLSLGYES